MDDLKRLEQLATSRADLVSGRSGSSCPEDDCSCDDQGCVGDDDSCGESDTSDND